MTQIWKHVWERSNMIFSDVMVDFVHDFLSLGSWRKCCPRDIKLVDLCKLQCKVAHTAWCTKHNRKLRWLSIGYCWCLYSVYMYIQEKMSIYKYIDWWIDVNLLESPLHCSLHQLPWQPPKMPWVGVTLRHTMICVFLFFSLGWEVFDSYFARFKTINIGSIRRPKKQRGISK